MHVSLSVVSEERAAWFEPTMQKIDFIASSGRWQEQMLVDVQHELTFLGFGVWGFGVWDLKFRVWGLGFGAQPGCPSRSRGLLGLVFRVQDLGVRV